ncbi:MAG: TetR/AcrR family transcriptional regulator [Leptonema illini]|uniref:TetR/AcrR family transcriptional regulator n=1 Tax=Leptonema illini TaxID=183 RepID=A0A833H1R0_9LEPT|nr:MAG: TetR/AcrR family transcriptional regulator [Leptonema illini]PKL32576.1 MAG: hypothetical protein CVV45_12015 [Spirochaetae bacterium HGW-Spirochaetae-10]
MKEAKTGRKHDRNAQESRQLILEAAFSLFAEKGFHGTTTKAIARQAGVSEGLIFHHFENKTAILGALVQGIVGSNLDVVMKSLLANREGDDLEAILKDVFDLFEKSAREGRLRDMIRIVFNSLMTLPDDEKQRFVRQIHDTLWIPLTEAMTPRMKNASVDPYIFFRIIQGSIMGYILFQEVLEWKKFVQLDPAQYRDTMASIMAAAVREKTPS